MELNSYSKGTQHRCFVFCSDLFLFVAIGLLYCFLVLFCNGVCSNQKLALTEYIIIAININIGSNYYYLKVVIGIVAVLNMCGFSLCFFFPYSLYL